MTDEDGPDDDGPDDAAAAPAAGGPEGERPRKRRRRRRGAGPAIDRPEGAAPAQQAQQPQQPGRERRQYDRTRAEVPVPTVDSQVSEAPPAVSGEPAAAAPTEPRERTRRRRGERESQPQQPRGGGQQQQQQQRPPQNREQRPPREARPPREPRPPAPAPPPRDPGPPSEPRQAPIARLEQQRRPAAHDDDDAPAPEPGVAWGTDDDGPPPVVTLAPDLPAEPPSDDDDPVTYPLADAPSAQLGNDVASVCGVRFVPGGRLSWVDCADAEWAMAERVLVDTERGQRLGWIAAVPMRRTAPSRERLRRVIRRANDNDLRGERDGDADRARALRVAKDKAADLRLPMKVFRVELTGPIGRGAKLNVYYMTDERLDLRDFVREVGGELGGARLELRQLGVRDEAKAVGGIGSCGLTLCCTTWLPDFVPVSIKMAKDQGLVLSPTKVSGQCGRLKCCLVYEQAGYAELRKGLPKLGKRVIGARGEGRVVEVDVLRQRVRVSYGAGDTEVVPASEVKALFPPGNQPARAPGSRDERRDPPEAVETESDDDALETDDPKALANLRPEAAPEPERARPAVEDQADADPEPDPFADLADMPDADPSRDPNADD
ncbi:MAG: regulatory iron-sulfur-containing complex subunit RicT [Kofleriaceae bacterium]